MGVVHTLPCVSLCVFAWSIYTGPKQWRQNEDILGLFASVKLFIFLMLGYYSLSCKFVSTTLHHRAYASSNPVLFWDKV